MAKIIDNFILVEPLGSGKCSETIKGRNLLTKDPVAVKTIRLDQFLSNQSLREMVINEIQILKKIEHPSIIQMIKMLKSSNNIYLVYEFLNGGSFQKNFSEKTLSISELPIILSQISVILSILQKNEIIHGNINMETLFMNNNTVKIKNFLSARSFSTKKSIEIDDIRFISPEILEFGIPTCKSDIFSMGIILLELIGKNPIDKNDSKDVIMNKIKSINIDNFKKSHSFDPNEIEIINIILEMLKYDESERINTEDLTIRIEEIKKYEYKLSGNIGNKEKETLFLKIERILFKERTKAQFVLNNLHRILNYNDWPFSFSKNLIVFCLLKSASLIINSLKNTLLDVQNTENLLFAPDFIEKKEITHEELNLWKKNSENFNYFINIYNSEAQEICTIVDKFKKEEEFDLNCVKDEKNIIKILLEFSEKILENIKKNNCEHSEDKDKAILANYLLDIVFFKEFFENFMKFDCKLNDQKYFKHIENVGIDKLNGMLEKKINYAKKQSLFQ